MTLTVDQIRWVRWSCNSPETVIKFHGVIDGSRTEMKHKGSFPLAPNVYQREPAMTTAEPHGYTYEERTYTGKWVKNFSHTYPRYLDDEPWARNIQPVYLREQFDAVMEQEKVS